MDPITGWPFFVDHLGGRTTWNDPRWDSFIRSPCSQAAYPSNPDHRSSVFGSPTLFTSPYYCRDPWTVRPPPSNGYGAERKSSRVYQPDHHSQGRSKTPEMTAPSPDSHGNTGVPPPVSEVKQTQVQNPAMWPPRTDTEGVGQSTETTRTDLSSPDHPVSDDEPVDAPPVTEEMSPDQVKESADTIETIRQKAEMLQERVQKCRREDGRERAYLEETLMGYTLQLDNVRTNGLAELRVARKSAVRSIQALLDTLEANAS